MVRERWISRILACVAPDSNHSSGAALHMLRLAGIWSSVGLHLTMMQPCAQHSRLKPTHIVEFGERTSSRLRNPSISPCVSPQLTAPEGR